MSKNAYVPLLEFTAAVRSVDVPLDQVNEDASHTNSTRLAESRYSDDEDASSNTLRQRLPTHLTPEARRRTRSFLRKSAVRTDGVPESVRNSSTKSRWWSRKRADKHDSLLESTQKLESGQRTETLRIPPSVQRVAAERWDAEHTAFASETRRSRARSFMSKAELERRLPKLVFALERTLLQWLNNSFLMTVSAAVAVVMIGKEVLKTTGRCSSVDIESGRSRQDRRIADGAGGRVVRALLVLAV
jgi:hypothetical protein